MQLIRDLFGLFNFVGDIYARIKKVLIPPRAFSWQTLIYLSLFSWLMSSLSTGFVRDIIAFGGWFFLIAGTAWYTTDNPLLIPGTNMPVGALVTGFLVSAFAFGREENIITTSTIVFWPIISALITAIPEFFEGTGTEVSTQIPKIEDRQKIIILIASSMVISSWLQLIFVVNRWYQEYPSLQSEDIQRTFVVRIAPLNQISRNGAVILEQLEPRIEQQIAGRPWSEVEQWLLEANQRVSNLGRQTIQNSKLRELEERFLWRVEPRIYNLKSGGYRLDLLSIWTGPSLTGRGYYLSKSCQIELIAKSRSNSTSNNTNNLVAEIDCRPVSKPIPGPPPAVQ